MKIKPPSVTQVLRETGAAVLYPDFRGVPEETLERKRCQGTDVARLCSLVGTKRAGLRLPDNPSGDYARQYIKWLDKTGATVVRTEFEVKGSIRGMKYIGHPDVEILWNGYLWIVDDKTTYRVFRVHGVQLAAYVRALEVSGYDGKKWRRRGVLWLSPSNAKLVVFKDNNDFDAWEACLTLFYWRRNKT